MHVTNKRLLNEHERICKLIYYGSQNRRQRLIAEELLREFDIMGDLGEMASSVLGAFSGGAFDVGKKYIIDAVLNSMGVSVDSFLGGVVAEYIENTELSNFPKYFADGGCNILADDLIQALSEYGANQFTKKIIDDLEMNFDSIASDFLPIDDIQGMPGMDQIKDKIVPLLTQTISETMTNEIIPKLSPFITTTICKIDMKELLFGLINLVRGQ